jgi:HSP20 family protein
MPTASRACTSNERFAGRFHPRRRATDDLDPNAVEARYRDGLLHVSIKRQRGRAAAPESHPVKEDP